MDREFLGKEFFSMRRKYISVFVAVMFLTMLAQSVIQYSIWMKVDHSKVINVAGRQRMLSQRIASLISHPASTGRDMKLKAALEDLSSSHRDLKYGNEDKSIAEAFNPTILSQYVALDPILEKLKVTLTCNDSPCEFDEKKQATVIELTEQWLPQMNEIVALSERYASNELLHLSLLEIAFFFGIVAFMAFEIFGVLIPYQRQVQIEREMIIHTSKLATLGEMSAGIAHEINNPLAVIQTGAMNLESMENQNKDSTDVTKSIQNSVSRIVRIVDSLKKFSRKQQTNTAKIYEVKELIDETLDLTRAKADRHKVKIETYIDPGTRAWCDDVQITQVLTNLIANSIDANSNTENPWIQIRARTHNKITRIHVIDSGHGIEKETLKKVFHPFFTTKPVGKGTGLGLSISKGIIEAAGGEIWYEKLGGHTTFTINLPTGPNQTKQPDMVS